VSEKPIQKIDTANHVPASLLKVTLFRIFLQEIETRKQILLIEVYYLLKKIKRHIFIAASCEN